MVLPETTAVNTSLLNVVLTFGTSDTVSGPAQADEANPMTAAIVPAASTRARDPTRRIGFWLEIFMRVNIRPLIAENDGLQLRGQNTLPVRTSTHWNSSSR